MMDQPAAAADVEPHIIALGRHPVDVAGGDAHQAGEVRRPEFVEPLRGFDRRFGRAPRGAAGHRPGRGRARARAAPDRPASSDNRPPRLRTRRPRTGRTRSRRPRPARTSDVPIARATSIPSSPGMAMSSSSTSGSSASAMRTALSPSLAVPTRSTPLAAREQQLQPLGRQRLVVGNQDLQVGGVSHRPDPAAGSGSLDSRRRSARPNSHCAALPKRALQPLADIAEADAGPSWRARAARLFGSLPLLLTSTVNRPGRLRARRSAARPSRASAKRHI